MSHLPPRLRDLPEAELDALIDKVVLDVCRLVVFLCPREGTGPCRVVTKGRRTPGGYADVWLTLAEHMDRLELPPPAVLSRVAGWALFELDFRARGRRLTDAECRIRASAQRIWDASGAALSH